MTPEESKLQILKQVEAGILSPEEGAGLLEILDWDGSTRHAQPSIPPAEASALPKIESPRVTWYWKLGWRLFLWLGVGLTVLSAYWMYQAYVQAGFGIGFILSWIPFLLGILLVYAGARLIEAPWVHLKVNQAGRAHPTKIDLAMPLPLGFIQWIIKTFDRFMPEEVRGKKIDELLAELERSIRNGEPFQVQVDDDRDGDHVEVQIA